ncbi:MAG: SGNH/GDSL hydrolase family protein [Rhodanobacteraceae bacterium]|nr:SGNH/GDSL hydrolase family protein [Xanthomonadales bacterium]MCP5477268.1 SGNH/GDSL hydrolase family protein [Rhodanobacteraceae bacterium]HPF74006.1 SGNH/GDSL hydrolase family protein [Xanthomonadaceae bacterium]HRY00382.1 SGNH/GDSL hydrolase family protein [Xanthomonadaceae bacterium]
MLLELIRTLLLASLLAGVFLLGARLNQANPQKAILRYLALGDSYTIGESVPEADRWPVQLVARLREGGVAIADPEILATTGWSTDELSAAMDAHHFTPPYDLVSLAIGVNNQYRGRNVDNYAAELDVLLSRAIALAGGRRERVFMLAIPDWGVTRFGQESGRDTAEIATQLDIFNARAAKQCAKHGIAFVDIMPVSRRRGGEVAMMADDGLHPSGALYAEWTALALPLVRDLVSATSDD